jgi:transposase
LGVGVGFGVSAAPWIVSDELWERIEPLLPHRQRRYRPLGHNLVRDRQVLSGNVYVLHQGIQREHPPEQLGFSSGMMCWRRA